MSDKTWAEGSKYRPKDQPIPERVKPLRRRKNTKRWCGGKEGREHQPEIVRHHYYVNPPFDTKDCHWWKTYRWHHGEKVSVKAISWSCMHARRCTVCGKYLETFLPKEECPTWLAQQKG